MKEKFITIHPIEALENKEIPHFVPIVPIVPIDIGIGIGTLFGMTLRFVAREEERSGALCAPLRSSSQYPPKLNCHSENREESFLIHETKQNIVNNKHMANRIELLYDVLYGVNSYKNYFYLKTTKI